jgi:hypothetical protein
VSDEARVVHTDAHAAPLGGVNVSLTHSTTGVTVALTVIRPRRDGEAIHAAAVDAAAVALATYDDLREQLGRRGLEPGPIKKPEPKP